MAFADRLLTIVITATLTSAAWIIFGGTWFDAATERGGTVEADEKAGTSDAEPGGVVEEAGPFAGTPDPGEPGTTGSAPAITRPSNAGPAPRSLTMPVEGVEPDALSDSFLQPRGADGERRHEAIDIMAEAGTAVLAAAPGTIAKLHRSGPGGLSIYVRSNDRRTIHYYAHLAAYAAGLAEGQQVAAGERLGTVGSSGNADPSAPHLHFAIIETTADASWWEPGNAINPYPLLARGDGGS